MVTALGATCHPKSAPQLGQAQDTATGQMRPQHRIHGRPRLVSTYMPCRCEQSQHCSWETTQLGLSPPKKAETGQCPNRCVARSQALYSARSCWKACMRTEPRPHAGCPPASAAGQPRVSSKGASGVRRPDGQLLLPSPEHLAGPGLAMEPRQRHSGSRGRYVVRGRC